LAQATREAQKLSLSLAFFATPRIWKAWGPDAVRGLEHVKQKDTIAIYFIRAAVARLAPPVRKRVLDAAAIRAELLALPQARVPAENFAALWLAVAREMDDEFFGLDSRRMKVGSFALLCQALLGLVTLEQAVKAICRGFALFLDDVQLRLAVQDGQAVIAIDNNIASPSDRLFADEALLVMTHGLMCWLIGKRIELRQAEFTAPRPGHASEYALMFSQRVRFDVAHTALYFDASVLQSRIVQNSETVRAFLRHAPQSVFLKYRNTDSWTARLRRRLRGCIGGHDWPLLQQLATEFRVTPTTLRRRLEAEGTTYRKLKDDLRRDAAVNYLCTTRISVAEVAGLLCFQDVSAFRRAFKNWTGVQPSQYRIVGAGTPAGPRTANAS
jgi:AraC-like DNA-binding protein